MTDTEKRIRANAKSTAKGIWYLDVTVEVSGENVTVDEVDVLKIIKEKEKEFREDGRQLAGDTSE